MQWRQNHQSWELSPCPHTQLLAHHTNDRNLESAVTWTAASKPKTQEHHHRQEQEDTNEEMW
jgi:hypothetical protein